MRYFAILVLITAVTGTAFGQENTTGGEEVAPEITTVALETEDLIGPDGRDMSSIRRRINEIKAVVQTDYEVLLATDPEAGGTITVSFSITPGGTVSDPSVDCPEELASLRENIISTLAELEFDPAPEQTENLPIEVPFTLTPPE